MNAKIYKYRGTIEEFGPWTGRDRNTVNLKIGQLFGDVAPTRLEAFAGLAQYLDELEGTDDEERYLDWDFFYDDNLFLAYIEIPSSRENRPAKVLASRMVRGGCEFRVFGPAEHITTSKPEPMSNDDYVEWRKYRQLIHSGDWMPLEK